MIRVHTCHTVTCNVCGRPLEDFEGATLHFPTSALARTQSRYYRWHLFADGYAICPETDAEHQAAMDDLLPPAPVVECDGQAALDLGGAL